MSRPRRAAGALRDGIEECSLKGTHVGTQHAERRGSRQAASGSEPVLRTASELKMRGGKLHARHLSMAQARPLTARYWPSVPRRRPWLTRSRTGATWWLRTSLCGPSALARWPRLSRWANTTPPGRAERGRALVWAESKRARALLKQAGTRTER